MVEFYTQIEDIAREVVHYKDQLENSIVLCNCNDDEWGHFWIYFKQNFKTLKLRKLITTHYEEEASSYKLVYDGKEVTKTPLMQNGDFRSPEALELLRECDICITGAPFNMFSEHLRYLMLYNKRFLVVGPLESCTCKEAFQYICEGKIRLGYTAGGSIRATPDSDGGIKYTGAGNIRWYTNLNTPNKRLGISLNKVYNPEDYPKYDNYDAINVDKVVEIPCDYGGIMGVPITFLDKYNPAQFTVVGLMAPGKINSYNFGRPRVKGKKVYARILIKRGGV
jgi:hypothetical protein